MSYCIYSDLVVCSFSCHSQWLVMRLLLQPIPAEQWMSQAVPGGMLLAEQMLSSPLLLPRARGHVMFPMGFVSGVETFALPKPCPRVSNLLSTLPYILSQGILCFRTSTMFSFVGTQCEIAAKAGMIIERVVLNSRPGMYFSAIRERCVCLGCLILQNGESRKRS